MKLSEEKKIYKMPSCKLLMSNETVVTGHVNNEDILLLIS